MWRFACLTLVAGSAYAHADVRGVVRFGVIPIELESSRDTPLFGDDIDRAVTAYNQAAAAYDQRYGGNTARVSESDLGVDDTLYTFAPGIELGNSIAFFRVEGQLGYGDDLRSYGLGLYPLNLQAPFSRSVTGYVSAGGTASYLDRDGDAGALVTARLAGGVRISRRIVLEAGYSAFMLGGVVDSDALTDYMPAPDAPPPSPQDVVSAGEASGVVDLSVGVMF